MKLNLLMAAAALSAVTFGATAHATVYPLGLLAPDTTTTVSTVNEGSGSDSDTFTFSIAGSDEVLSTGAFTQGGAFSITDVDLKLYSAANVLEGEVHYDPQTTLSQTVDVSLPAGSYYILADTTVPAGSAGSYTLTATTVSAAPEPSIWMLMIAGVAMIGGALRLRRRNDWSMTAA